MKQYFYTSAHKTVDSFTELSIFYIYYIYELQNWRQKNLVNHMMAILLGTEHIQGSAVDRRDVRLCFRFCPQGAEES